MKKIFSIFILLSLNIFAKSITLDDMISQMIITGFSGETSGDKWVKQISKDIINDKISGLYFNKNNIRDKKQLKKLTIFLKSFPTKHKLFFSIQKLDILSSYKNQRYICTNEDISYAAKTYEKEAKELKQLGFNLVYSPSLDIYRIGDEESCSSMQDIITSYSLSFIDILKKEHIVSVLKNFPGLSNLKKWEYRALKPYFDLIKWKKAEAIMLSKNIIKNLDEKDASFMSKKIIKNILREKLNFNGVTFSPILNSNDKDLKEKVINSIKSGIDVLVFNSYFTKKSNIPKNIKDTITKAVEDGIIKKSTIKNAYVKIIKLKKTMVK